ncbi:MAG: hypothetical protein MR350_00815 [Alphaproteobacteria bacterium]|nr:hypothetical protein [Alphaproteobacteria bacterium]
MVGTDPTIFPLKLRLFIPNCSRFKTPVFESIKIFSNYAERFFDFAECCLLKGKTMDTDNAFETLIELLSTPVMILLDEQENGGKVSNLLDNNEIPSIGSNKEVTNG